MKALITQNRQFLLYCIIGLSGTMLDFGAYSMLLRSGLLEYQAANVVGYASGTLLSFILNTRYNFRISDRLFRRLACFFGVALVGLSISAVLLHVLVDHYHVNRYLAKVPTLVAVMLVQYNLNRWISFRRVN